MLLVIDDEALEQMGVKASDVLTALALGMQRCEVRVVELSSCTNCALSHTKYESAVATFRKLIPLVEESM